MAVEFARIAEVWHHFQVDVIFITFCSRLWLGLMTLCYLMATPWCSAPKGSGYSVNFTV